MPGLRDYRGCAVEVTDDGWQHILTRHPEMGSRLAEIEAASTAPVAVTRAGRRTAVRESLWERGGSVARSGECHLSSD